MNSYVRGTLGYESDLPYNVMAQVAWNFGAFEGRYVNVGPRLAEAMKDNPRLKVWVGVSERDLAIAPDAMLYSVDHLEIPTSLRTNITTTRYQAGHMMYLYAPDAEKLRRDLTEFIKRTTDQ